MQISKIPWERAIAWRAARQHLEDRVPRGGVGEVASRLCGLHAQLMSSAELTLWARVEGLEAGDAARLLWEERSLFKTWAMRGTLHLLPSPEYGRWQGGWSTFDHYKKGAWFKYFGIDLDRLQAVVDATGRALDGKVLTREELAAEVARLTGRPEVEELLRGSWGALLKPASFQGKLCFGPDRGRNVCFTNPQSWLGGRPAPAVPAEEAIDAITRQFLGAFAPATREDYARWWGCSPAAAQARLKRAGGAAAEVEVGGVRMWVPASEVDALANHPEAAGVKLLPAFDQYVIAATRHAEQLLDGPFKARIYRAQGWISPVLLVGGRMAGVWRHERKPGRLAVTVEPFGKLGASVKKAVREEAESLSRFFESTDLALEFAG